MGGQPFVRPDAMTGIKGGAVSFYSCVNAEKQGLLVATGYRLSPTVIAAKATADTGAMQVAGAVPNCLIDSGDFLWVAPSGEANWGRKQTLEAFQVNWHGGWTLDPQLTELRIATIAPRVAVLDAPVGVTRVDADGTTSTRKVSWGSTLVKTSLGWRIAAILVTPLRA